MGIKKKAAESFIREDAHGGSGGRKLLLDNNEMPRVQGMTHGFLPAGGKFALHTHEGMNETMYVLKGHGIVLGGGCALFLCSGRSFRLCGGCFA